jgi:hypothetical protein
MSSWTKVCSVIALFFFVFSCALLPYEPTVDFRGSEKKGADLERYDDDLSSCKKLSEQTISAYDHNVAKWSVWSEDTERAIILRKCLTGRGWSVVR